MRPRAPGSVLCLCPHRPAPRPPAPRWIYQNKAAFTDIVKGTNAIGRGTGPDKYGYNCTVGWDPATGLGTPLFGKMLAAALAGH